MFSQSTRLEATCARCGAARELPEADRARWPATDQAGTVTVTADVACRCGSRRIKLTLKLE